MSWHSRLLLVRPRRVEANLHTIREAGVIESTPNLWQVELGVLRMWHRTFFRSDTIGTCELPVRNTWRAKILHRRPVRFPFLVQAKAIAPWDMSGLAQPEERLIAHLLGAHHDATQFVYDLQILKTYPGALCELRRRLDQVLDGSHPRAEWLRDLCVFEGYHEALSAGLDRFLDGVQELAAEDANDPDVSFYAYLRWCALQPPTPAATLSALRKGAYHPQHGIALEVS